MTGSFFIIAIPTIRIPNTIAISIRYAGKKPIYGEIVRKINGKTINNLFCTFQNCKNMVTAPTIPETVTIGTDGTEKTVSAEGVVVEKGQYVSVTLAENNDFTVKTAEGAELAYTVTANGEAVAAGGEILAVNPADGKTGTATITFDIDETAIQYAGTYTGSATFTVAVKPVS